MRLRLQGLALALAAALALAGPAAAAPRSLPGTPVPKGFVGVDLDGPPLIAQDNIDLASQFKLMQSNGVQSVRTVFDWAAAQPYASWNNVPADQQSTFAAGSGNVPTQFAATDQIVGLAAEHGITVLPTVMYTPSWDAGKAVGNSLRAPLRNGPYGQFITTLIDRYGPNGSFWAQYPGIPRRPIRMWEVWNEPWIQYYWPIRPFERTYLALLRVAHTAAKRADPNAEIVLGGMPNASWEVLKTIYKTPGARGLFDVVDIHAYTKYPAGVIKILQLDRAVMSKAGDAHKPIIVGEMGWTSSLHQTSNPFDWDTTPKGQASNVRSVLTMLAANRVRLGLAGFYWYTWMGDQYRGASPWGFAGLVGYHDGGIFDKPALTAFRGLALKLEPRR